MNTYEAENGTIWYGHGDIWVFVSLPGIEKMTEEQAQKIADLLNTLERETTK